MAKPIEFPEVNTTLRGDGGVQDLPCYRDGNNVISLWQLTPAEAMMVATTGQIWFHYHGNNHSPIRIGAESPFERAKN